MGLTKKKRRLIPQIVLAKSFCKSRFPHKSVNLSAIITNIKNELSDVCGNELLQNDVVNTFYEIRALPRDDHPHLEHLSHARGTSLIRNCPLS